MRKTAVAVTLLFVSAFATGATRSAPQPTDRDRAIHILNRLSFGPRPGEVDAVMNKGVDAWIDEQLHPERIRDTAVDERLQQVETLRLTTPQLVEKFYLPVLRARQKSKQEQKNGAPDDDLKAMRQQIPPDRRPIRILEELTSARIIRAAESDRQLNEVMVDFWMNHFNVYAAKGADRVLVTSFERDTIRPNIWGKFDELLMATAKSPAMLFYLDNARSVADPQHRPAVVAAQRGFYARPLRGGRNRFDARGDDRFMQRQMRATQVAQRKGGLNENYAREIMELHTLGVDGGYTQKDVTELARVFTGWSIERPERGSGFVFRAQMHDIGEKTVLGVHFREGGGIEEGERMIHLLAHQPATAHHIAFELCQRLVADDPPPGLVDRVAKRFLATDGDLRETVRAIVTSPEFFDPRYAGAKVKSPLEYVVSAIRAVDAETADVRPIARSLREMGEPLYLAQPPTGYSNKGETWMNAGALMARFNFALALATGKLPGVHANLIAAPASGPDRVDLIAHSILGKPLSPATRKTIDQRINATPDSSQNDQLLTALILGSPEFQQH